MNQVFNADDSLLAKRLFNDVVGREGRSAVVDLSETTLVQQFPHALHVRVSPSDLRFADTEHVDRSLVQLNKHSIVDLSETEQLQSLANLRMLLVNTTNSDDERQFGFSWNIVVALVLGLTSKTDFITFLLTVLLDVLLSTLEDFHTLVTH